MKPQQSDATLSTRTRLRFDLGTFEGFNLRTHSAIDRVFTAQEVVDWDCNQAGEVELRPSGDRPEVALIFGLGGSVSGGELLALDQALQHLDKDSIVEFLKIHYAANIAVGDLATWTPEELDDADVHVFVGSNVTDLRLEAARALFKRYWPQAHHVWKSDSCDWLIFDVERFLSSPKFMDERVKVGDQVALIVCRQ